MTGLLFSFNQTDPPLIISYYLVFELPYHNSKTLLFLIQKRIQSKSGWQFVVHQKYFMESYVMVFRNFLCYIMSYHVMQKSFPPLLFDLLDCLSMSCY